MNKTFYCKGIYNPEPIEEWNKRFKQANQMGLTGKAYNDFVDGKTCTEQCPECACIVGETRIKTQQLIKEQHGT